MEFHQRRVFSKSYALGLKTIFLVILGISLLIFDGRMHSTSLPHRLLNWVVMPIQYSVALPADAAHWIHDRIHTQHHLIFENNQLKEQLLLLQAKLQKLTALQEENNDLQALLDAGNEVSTRVLAAKILAINANPDDEQVVINKGSDDGVYLNQPALDQYGIFGQVISVEAKLSRILLISSTRSAVPVIIVRNGLRSTLVGQGKRGTMSLINVTESSDVKVGDQLISSGLGLCFPSGYPVATVTQVEHVAGNRFLQIEAAPSAKLSSSRQLLLVWPKHSQTFNEAKKLAQ